MTSALGGWAAGVLADRYGRVRILQLTIAWFALFTFLSGFTDSFLQLLIVRSMQGLGFGGEWAVGSILIAETIRPANRGRATGLVQSSWAVGWAAAACTYWGAYALMPPQQAWRVMLWSGVLPGLLVVYIRRNVAEPSIYLQARQHAHAKPMARQFLQIFSGPLLQTTVLASLLSAGMLGAYYSVTTWLPTFLKSERHLSVTGTATYLLVLIAGCFAGYLSSAWLSDVIGRRRCFVVFALGGIFAVLAYTHIRADDLATEVLGFPLGFFNSGIFAGTGAYLTESVSDRGTRFRAGILLQLRPRPGRGVPRLDRARDGRVFVGRSDRRDDRRRLPGRDSRRLGIARNARSSADRWKRPRFGLKPQRIARANSLSSIPVGP